MQAYLVHVIVPTSSNSGIRFPAVPLDRPSSNALFHILSAKTILSTKQALVKGKSGTGSHQRFIYYNGDLEMGIGIGPPSDPILTLKYQLQTNIFGNSDVSHG